jgi:hypothetical protein
MPTVTEFRKTTFDRLAACRDTKAAHAIVTEAAGVLQASREIGNIDSDDERQFWASLSAELQRIDLRLVEKQAAASLSQVIAAAQAVIAQHQARASK